MTATGMPTRSDHIRRYVTAFCPRCHDDDPELAAVRRLPGYLAEDDGRVWLVRGCPDHGRITTLYDEDAEILDWLERWTAPTKHVNPDTPGNFTPAPAGYLDGLGELQTQHTCILLEDLTDSCNLSCPTCFAASSPALEGVVPITDVLANVDAAIEREQGHLDVLMLSGGEPTLHPGFGDLLDALADRPIVRVLVNTNGLTLAQPDSRVLAALRRHRTLAEAYLQFDGFDLATHRHHRGADLRRAKQRALDALVDAQVFTTLTMTAALGVNDHEIGAVVLAGLERPYVTGVSIQPVFGSGRSQPIDPLDRLTHTGTLARLGPQTDGVVTWRDLTALPCSHPHCCSVGYMFRVDGDDGQPGPWRSLVDLLGPDQLLAHLDLVANRGMVDTDLSADMRRVVRHSLLDLLSESSSLTNPRTGDLLAALCEACDLGVSGLASLARDVASRHRLRKLLATRVVRLTVKPFMDVNTMIDERLLQCCVHVGTRSDAKDQCAPFCAVQAWAPLSAQRLSTVASEADAPDADVPVAEVPDADVRRSLPVVT